MLNRCREEQIAKSRAVQKIKPNVPFQPRCRRAASSLREDWAFENRHPPPCRGAPVNFPLDVTI
jgi:hypothetical protein